MQTQLIFLQADSLANHIHQQEKDLAKRMTDTSGLKCLESFEKFNRPGLWAKMFSGLLIGQEGWYSTKCNLTWKLKGTKYNRMYFQLYPSMRPTEEIEFGLLPTVTTMDSTSATANMKSTQVKEGSMHSVTLARALTMGMLPTPTVADGGKVPCKANYGQISLANHPSIVGYPTRPKMQKDRKGLDGSKMLNIPTASDKNGGCTRTNQKLQLGSSLVNQMHGMLERPAGKTSQLNPHFVMEMMGFPTDWTLLPFLNGEESQSKPEEMP
jgi:hypothetical protein